VIIDPGDEDELIVERVTKAGFAPEAILLTHGHVDHIAAVAPVKEHYDIPLYIGRGDETMLANPSSNASAYLAEPVIVPDPDFLLINEELISFGSLSFKVLATPGHTPGGVCFLDEAGGILFCGDTLFQMSIGRTDLPGGSTGQLLESINKKILTLPDDIVCYPGHGPRTTVGAERNQNPFLAGSYYG
jgi:glyoxylase-like metal-dependent hydrolase (beta-lactamase superfamily II)